MLAQILLHVFFDELAVAYVKDEVSRLIRDTIDLTIYSEVAYWNVAQLKIFLLDENNDSVAILLVGRGLSSEMSVEIMRSSRNQ